MISASTLPVARPRVMPAAVAEARAVRSHAALRRLPRPGAILEPLILLLTAAMASVVLGGVIAGALLGL